MKKTFPASLLLLFCLICSAQNNSLQQKYSHQLQLVDSVKAYIENTLHLNTGEDFYTKWSTQKDSMYYYLYVSKANRVEAEPSNTFGYTTYSVEDSALLHCIALKKQGLQAFVYKTAGTATAELTPKLLNYPDEAIAFILVHEAVHRHISSMHLEPRYPYYFEECLCDAMANKVCIEMAEKHLINLKAAVSQKQIFENTYAYLNHQRAKLDSAGVKGQAKIFKETTARIKLLVQRGNQFQKDRMIYEVNNAYFLRIESYAAHYFEVKKMLYSGKSLTEVISIIYKREKAIK